MSEHILVVDDDASIRGMLMQLLEFEGYGVETAANGAEALDSIARHRPSVMLLDMRMPVLDGWGVARRLREQGDWVPTVVVTAAENARRWCAEIAADACIGKPFDADELLAAVEQVRTHEAA